MLQAGETRNAAVTGREQATRKADRQSAADNSQDLNLSSQRLNTRPVGTPDYGSYPFGAPPCRIYRTSPSVKQAGRARRRTWVLKFDAVGSRWSEPLMGWDATDDPFSQIRLGFTTLAAAVEYAEREGLHYQVIEPPARRFIRKSYRETIIRPGVNEGASRRTRLPRVKPAKNMEVQS